MHYSGELLKAGIVNGGVSDGGMTPPSTGAISLEPVFPAGKSDSAQWR